MNEIYKALRERICTNRYLPGTILNETELGAEFGTSRTPIRQVLQKLSHDGLVETKNGVGTLVTEIDTRTIADLYRLRMKLAEVIGEFSRSADVSIHIAAFEILLEQAGRLGPRPDYEAIGRINVAVVEALQNLIGSEPLRELTALLYFRTARVWHKAIPHLDWNEERELVNTEIKEILRALRLGEIEGVGFVRRNFIAMAYARLSRHLTGSAAGPQMGAT
jgi:DNA-binding GntR family transcriptional regulator